MKKDLLFSILLYHIEIVHKRIYKYYNVSLDLANSLYTPEL